MLRAALLAIGFSLCYKLSTAASRTEEAACDVAEASSEYSASAAPADRVLFQAKALRNKFNFGSSGSSSFLSADCVEFDVGYGGHDLGQDASALTAGQCQETCQGFAECTHFSFIAVDATTNGPICLLKAFGSSEDIASFRFDLPKAVSGRGQCPRAGLPSAASALEKKGPSLVKASGDVEEVSTCFDSDMVFWQYDEKSGDIGSKDAKSSQECQSKCASNTACTHFVFRELDIAKNCQLKRFSPQAHVHKSPAEGAVSGPAMCDTSLAGEVKPQQTLASVIAEAPREAVAPAPVTSLVDDATAAPTAAMKAILQAHEAEFEGRTRARAHARAKHEESASDRARRIMKEAGIADPPRAPPTDVNAKPFGDLDAAPPTDVNTKPFGDLEASTPIPKDATRKTATAGHWTQSLVTTDKCKAGWALGTLGRSCTTTCASAGKVCREESMERRLEEVNTGAKMSFVMEQLGGSTCKEYTGLESVDVPAIKPDAGLCFFSASPRAAGTLDCAAAPQEPDAVSKQRLCWCDGACAPSELPAPESWMFLSAGKESPRTKHVLSNLQMDASRSFDSAEWKVGETWTMKVTATSNDKMSRRFGFAGNGGALSLEVPPGVFEERLEMTGAIEPYEAIGETTKANGVSFRYLGEEKTGEIFFTDAYVAPGRCGAAVDDAAAWRKNIADGRCPSGGRSAHGRCWYLSQKAATCSSTCNERGLSFSYFTTDVKDTLVPRLTGRDDLRKQWGWGALECYAEGENRYHAATREGAQGGDNPKAWHHPNCRLACPCSPCPDGGIWKHGRCWHLSQLGATCDATCGARGLSFSIFVPDEEEPMVPELLSLASVPLVDKMPEFKQFSWGAVECLVPGESRFHTASATGIGIDDPGKWSQPHCRLACSCEVPT